MNTMLEVITCLTMNLLLVYGQSTCCPVEDCCEDTMFDPRPINLTIEELVAVEPLYVVFMPANPSTVGLDNICYTDFLLRTGTYLLTDVAVYTENFNTSVFYIKTMSELGVYPIGSTVCKLDIVTFDHIQTEDCDVYLNYQRINFGDCSAAGENTIPITGTSPNYAPITEECFAKAMDSINRAGFSNQEYFILPMELPNGCILELPCSINNA